VCPQLAPGGVSWAVNERQAEALIRAGEALERAQGSIEGERRLRSFEMIFFWC
jgi:hypothetical protein